MIITMFRARAYKAPYINPKDTNENDLAQVGSFFCLSRTLPFLFEFSQNSSTMAAARSAPATGSWLVVRESYTIKTGDTLWAIARDHGVTIEDLQSWNNIPDPNRILAGNRLIVRQGTRDTPGAFAYKSNPY